MKDFRILAKKIGFKEGTFQNSTTSIKYIIASGDKLRDRPKTHIKIHSIPQLSLDYILLCINQNKRLQLLEDHIRFFQKENGFVKCEKSNTRK